MKTAGNKGFTLIEMSIVMAIIALITGGILLGKDLIHAAEIRATLQQVEQFDTAYNAFRLKYNCIPGDCPNATEQGFVGGFTILLAKADEEPGVLDYFNPISDAYAFVLMELEVCVGCVNGNGNGIIDIDVDHLEPPISLSLLSQAQFISGLEVETTKLYLPIRSQAVIAAGVGRPAFWFTSYFTPDTNSLIAPLGAGHYYTPVATLYPVAGASVIAPADAQAIDAKRDDGLPTKGRMMASTAANVDLVRGPEYDPINHKGPAGRSSPFCITLENTYNVLNPDMMCSVMIRATF